MKFYINQSGDNYSILEGKHFTSLIHTYLKTFYLSQVPMCTVFVMIAEKGHTYLLKLPCLQICVHIGCSKLLKIIKVFLNTIDMILLTFWWNWQWKKMVSKITWKIMWQSKFKSRTHLCMKISFEHHEMVTHENSHFIFYFFHLMSHISFKYCINICMIKRL